jgi:hypothetical protein
MTKLFTKVRGKTFQVWEGATKTKVTKMLNDYNKGIIIVCPVCRHVDINPFEHFSKCDPIAEQYRRESQEHY